MTVSIIVPMFHGKRFLDDILNQIELCARNVEETKVELILMNDSPDEEIHVHESVYTYHVKTINPGFNSGIHGARVHALSYAVGDYVVFLDQDDKIKPTYLKEQLECIGEADAVVCRAIYHNKLHYTNTHIFEEVVTKNFMLKKWNPIISPGQVLMRKDAIPQLWKENILKNNGADDYFLWLLMASKGSVFSLNQEILFEHVETGRNASDDTNNMMDSELEMVHILRNNNIFDEDVLINLLESLRRMHVKQLDTLKLSEGPSPLDFFERHNLYRIAIYGAGDLGKSIETVLKNTDVKVCFYIDQNAEFIQSKLPVYRKECVQGEVDAVIITIKNKAVKEEVKKLLKCPVYEVDDIWR